MKRIISVSRRTDIPALYANWLLNRLKEGFAAFHNPQNRAQRFRVSLKPDDVLLENLEEKGLEVYAVGDCREPNLIVDAIADGSRVARLI